MRYLVDTCAISELTRFKPDKNVVGWFKSSEESSLYLSVLTIGEIRKGINKLPASEKRNVLLSWLENDLSSRFYGRIINIDASIAIEWGNLLAKVELAGISLPSIDSLIAATALKHNLILVTRNRDDFKHVGVEIINPWN